MRTLSNFIDGDLRPALDGATEAVLNPATGEEIARAPLSGAADIDAAVAAAKRAFETWSQTTPAARADALLALASKVEEHGEELAREEAINAGKPIAGGAQRRGGRDVRQPALLRRRRALHGGSRRRRVHGGPHVDHPPRAGRRRSVRSRPGTTRC